MNKLLLVTAAASVLGLATFGATAAEADHGFISGSFGRAHTNVHGLDKTTNDSLGIRGGYRFNVSHSLMIGPEIGYTRFGANTFRRGGPDDITHGSLKNKAWLLGANTVYGLNANWFMTAHAGFLFAKTKFEVHNETVKSRIRRSRMGEYVGAGVGYNINEHLGVGFNYDLYSMKSPRIFRGRQNIGIPSLEAELRF